jgi:hypothetical protein
MLYRTLRRSAAIATIPYYHRMVQRMTNGVEIAGEAKAAVIA